MADKAGPQPTPKRNAIRDARLAETLRDNLRKRKAQVRARQTDEPPPSDPSDQIG